MNGMKTAIFAALLAAGIASAAEPAKPPATDAKAADAKAADAKAADAKPAADAKAARRKDCDPPSGSRIKPPANGPCKAVIEPYRTWSEKQIRDTGELNTADGLAKLDPIITVN